MKRICIYAALALAFVATHPATAQPQGFPDWIAAEPTATTKRAAKLMELLKPEMDEDAWLYGVYRLERELDAGIPPPEYLLNMIERHEQYLAHLAMLEAEASYNAVAQNEKLATIPNLPEEVTRDAAPVVSSGMSHHVAAGSYGNAVVLSVANVASEPYADLKVAARDVPPWLKLEREEVYVGELASGAETRATFNFSVAPEAPAGETAAFLVDVVGPEGTLTTSRISVLVELPDKVALNQNYPNPFNPTTRIVYELPKEARVTLTIFNVLGQEVARLLNETVGAGRQTVVWDAAGIPSGAYFYVLDSVDADGDRTLLRRKMLLVK